MIQYSSIVATDINNPEKFGKLVTPPTTIGWSFNPIMKQSEDHECGIIVVMFVLETLMMFHSQSFINLEPNMKAGKVTSYTMPYSENPFGKVWLDQMSDSKLHSLSNHNQNGDE